MRTAHRLLAPTAALLLGASLVAVAPNALAAPGALAAPAARAEQVEREITIKPSEPQENVFVVKGRITPSTGKRVDAVLDVKHCKKDKDCGADWEKYEAITTNAKGRYSERVEGPAQGDLRVYYRVRTHETKKFLAAVSDAVYIYRIY